MDQSQGHQRRGTFASVSVLDPTLHPIIVGGVIGLIAVWVFTGIKDVANFEAFQWWFYVNYDFTPRVNPFAIGPFLAGVLGGYTAGYLTDGLYETAIANAVKANLLAGGLYYVTIVLRSISSIIQAGAATGDLFLVATLQPLIFIAIPFTMVFLGQAIIAGPLGQYVRRKLLGVSGFPEDDDGPTSRMETAKAGIKSGLLIVALTGITWAILYSFYLFLSP